MRFRSLACDGADERRTRWDGNARRRYGNARRFHATFDDGTNADAPRSHDEFTLGLQTPWQPRLQSNGSVWSFQPFQSLRSISSIQPIQQRRLYRRLRLSRVVGLGLESLVQLGLEPLVGLGLLVGMLQLRRACTHDRECSSPRSVGTLHSPSTASTHT